MISCRCRCSRKLCGKRSKRQTDIWLLWAPVGARKLHLFYVHLSLQQRSNFFRSVSYVTAKTWWILGQCNSWLQNPTLRRQCLCNMTPMKNVPVGFQCCKSFSVKTWHDIWCQGRRKKSLTRWLIKFPLFPEKREISAFKVSSRYTDRKSHLCLRQESTLCVVTLTIWTNHRPGLKSRDPPRPIGSELHVTCDLRHPTPCLSSLKPETSETPELYLKRRDTTGNQIDCGDTLRWW